MQRLWTFLSAAVQRVAYGATTTLMLLSGTEAQPGYPTLNSMSAMGRFPWVRVCVNAVSGDAAGLPLVAVKRAPGGSARAQKRELVHDPILELLEQPSPGVTGTLLRRQLWVDWLLTGNWYVWRPSPDLLFRLHPSHVTPKVVGYRIVSYRVWDAERGEHFDLPPYDRGTGVGLLHVRDASWTDDLSAVLGESAIRCLHDDLLIELGAKTLAASQAAKGRPDMLLATEHTLGPKMSGEISDTWEKAVTDRKGAFVTGRGIKATLLSWSPKEFEYAARSGVTRDVILAVFEVPSARAGGPAVNYGTQKQQMRTYWESIRTRCRLHEDGFSLLAAPGVRVEHDFQDLEALQVSYTERIAQIGALVTLGATPAAAADYVGLDDAPLPDEIPEAFTRPQNIDKRPEEPTGDRSLLVVSLAAYFAEAQPRYVEMAAAAEGGSDISLLVRWETERLAAILDRHTSHAKWWACELAGATIEGARIARDDEDALGRLFGAERADRTAADVRRRGVA